MNLFKSCASIRSLHRFGAHLSILIAICVGVAACGPDKSVAFGVQDAARVEITPATAAITEFGAAGAVQLTAQAFTVGGNAFLGSVITWGTDDASVATVVGSGTTATVKGVGDGATQIWAVASPATASFDDGRTDITVAIIGRPFVLDFDFSFDHTGASSQRLATTNGASDTIQHFATGGNPGGWERMVHVLPAGTAMSPTSITTVSLLGAGYDPSDPFSGGAILSIDYYVDQMVDSEPVLGLLPMRIGGRISKSSNEALMHTIVGTGFALQQGESVYQYRQSDITSTSWESVSALNLTASDFQRVSDTGPANPDFSGSGSYMSFGFSRISEGYMGIFPTARVHAIDNIRIEVYR